MMNNDEFRKDVYERFETHKKKKAERQKNLIKYGSFALCIAIMISAVPVIRGLSLADGKSNAPYEPDKRIEEGAEISGDGGGNGSGFTDGYNYGDNEPGGTVSPTGTYSPTGTGVYTIGTTAGGMTSDPEYTYDPYATTAPKSVYVETYFSQNAVEFVSDGVDYVSRLKLADSWSHYIELTSDKTTNRTFSYEFIENENEDGIYSIKNALVFETVGYCITAEQRGLVDGKYKYDIIIWRTGENTDGYVDENVKGVIVFYEEPVTVEFILNVTPYVSPAVGTTVSPLYLPSTEPYMPGGTTEPYIPTQSGDVSGTLDMTTDTTEPLMTTNPNP